MNRSFALPTLGGVAMSMTSACSSGIVGDWTVTQYSYDGVVYQLPYSYSYASSGVTYTYASGLWLLVQDDGDAAFGVYYAYTSSAGDSYGTSYLYAGTWTKKGRGFTVDIPENSLSMDCTQPARDTLSCEGRIYGEPIEMDLAPKPDED